MRDGLIGASIALMLAAALTAGTTSDALILLAAALFVGAAVAR
jgi:hypothetical protein